jgi:hypothetical protein
VREKVGMAEKRTLGAWSAERKATFLAELAATCCVQRAAEAAGVAPSSCYSRRLRDPQFAADWEAAIAIGYAQVEERLILDAMGRAANDDGGDGAAGGPRMDKYEREQALNLLKWHRAEAVLRPRSRGGAAKIAAEDETDAAILARLAAVKKRMQR